MIRQDTCKNENDLIEHFDFMELRSCLQETEKKLSDALEIVRYSITGATMLDRDLSRIQAQRRQRPGILKRDVGVLTASILGYIAGIAMTLVVVFL